MSKVFRSFTAEILAVQGDKRLLVKVMKIDLNYTSGTSLSMGGRVILDGVEYTEVKDLQANHPTFDFYSHFRGSKAAKVGDEIVVLVELVDKTGGDQRGYRPAFWTFAAEYRAVQDNIKARKAAVTAKKTPAPKLRVVMDNTTYILTIDTGIFMGTRDQISRELYKAGHSQKSSKDGSAKWPPFKKWEKLEGEDIKDCKAPAHPGVNNMFEGHLVARAKVGAVNDGESEESVA